jgi:hypothetical protein
MAIDYFITFSLSYQQNDNLVHMMCLAFFNFKIKIIYYKNIKRYSNQLIL